MCIGLQIFHSHSPTCKLSRGYWRGHLVLRPIRKFGGWGEGRGGEVGAVTVKWASPRFRHPHSQNPVIWASPSHITLAIWVRVRVTRDAHITRVLGMGIPITLWQWVPLPFSKEKALGARLQGWGRGTSSEEPARRLQPHVYMRQFLRTGPSF